MGNLEVYKRQAGSRLRPAVSGFWKAVDLYKGPLVKKELKTLIGFRLCICRFGFLQKSELAFYTHPCSSIPFFTEKLSTQLIYIIV